MAFDLICGPQLLQADSPALLRLLVLAPLLEEWVLRAGLQEAWLRRGKHPGAGIWLCAAVFCLLHALSGWQRALAVGLPGLAVGVLYQVRRQWLLCALAHAAMNALALGWCN